MKPFRTTWQHDFSQFVCRFIIVAALLSYSIIANAGYIELGGSGNYRQTYVNEVNYSITQSLTGSISYYFWENSALEMSYTSGRSSNITPAYTATAYFELYGLDFVLSFGAKEAFLRPYAKLGAAYQKKSIVYQQALVNAITETSEGASPSAGFGFKLALSQTLGLKVGVEAWSSPITSDSSVKTTYDIAARAGISWIF